jgi:hypothetical protein
MLDFADLFYIRDLIKKMNCNTCTRKTDKNLVISVILGVMLCSSLGVSPSSAGEKIDLGQNEVFALGDGKVAKGNVAVARRNAVSQALAKGMESYLVLRLGVPGVVNNFERIIQEVLPGAKEGIENFYILAEGQIGDKYMVFMRLRINEKVLDKKLKESGLIFKEGPRVKMLFMVSEIRDGALSCWWKDLALNAALNPTELALYNEFQERGFSPINRILNIPEMEYSEDLRSPDLQNDGVLTWGKAFSADVVIYGHSEITDEKEFALSLKAFDVNQGVQICQNVQVDVDHEDPEDDEPITEMIESLVNRAVVTMGPEIIYALALAQKKIHYLDITIEGLSNLKQLRSFKEFLGKYVIGVKSVREAMMTKGSVSYIVEFQGDRDGFLSHILNNQKLPFTLGLEEAEEGRLLLRVE